MTSNGVNAPLKVDRDQLVIDAKGQRRRHAPLRQVWLDNLEDLDPVTANNYWQALAAGKDPARDVIEVVDVTLSDVGLA